MALGNAPRQTSHAAEMCANAVARGRQHVCQSRPARQWPGRHPLEKNQSRRRAFRVRARPARFRQRNDAPTAGARDAVRYACDLLRNSVAGWASQTPRVRQGLSAQDPSRLSRRGTIAALSHTPLAGCVGSGVPRLAKQAAGDVTPGRPGVRPLQGQRSPPWTHWHRHVPIAQVHQPLTCF